MHECERGRDRIGERAEVGRGAVGAVWRRAYVPNGGGCPCRLPVNGQDALDNSVSVPENAGVLVGVDYEARELVVFHQHRVGEFRECGGHEIFHGHVVAWAELPQPCRQALIASRLVSAAGEIL